MEREEFAGFYAASFQRLVGQLYAMIGDQCEAQDAVQEAFVRAWARRGKIDRNGAPEAWVRVTAWRIQPGKAPTVTIDPRAMPAGTELSFGNFQLANGGRTFIAVIDQGSYTCTSTAPTAARGDAVFGFGRSPSR